MTTYIVYVASENGRGGRTGVEAASSFAARQEYVRRYPDSVIQNVCAVAPDSPSYAAALRVPAAPMPSGLIAELRAR